MNRSIRCGTGVSIVVLAAVALLVSPMRGYPQTQGMERRQDRRDDRDDARSTRQPGRHAARGAKQECRDAGGNPIACRQEKRNIKQGARGAARDINDAVPRRS